MWWTRLDLFTLLVRGLGSISKRLGREHNFIISLGLHFELCTFDAPVEICGDVARRVLRRAVEFGHTSVDPIHAVVEPWNNDAVFAVDFGGAICHYFLLAGLTRHLHDSTFKMLLVMRLFWVAPVIASVAVDFSDHLNNHGVVGWWWRFVVVGRWGW